MERESIHFTVHVRNVSNTLGIDRFSIAISLRNAIRILLFCRDHVNKRHSLPQKEKAKLPH